MTDLVFLGVVVVVDALAHHCSVEVEDRHGGDDGHQDEEVAGRVRHLLEGRLSLKQGYGITTVLC